MKYFQSLLKASDMFGQGFLGPENLPSELGNLPSQPGPYHQRWGIQKSPGSTESRFIRARFIRIPVHQRPGSTESRFTRTRFNSPSSTIPVQQSWFNSPGSTVPIQQFWFNSSGSTVPVQQSGFNRPLFNSLGSAVLVQQFWLTLLASAGARPSSS